MYKIRIIWVGKTQEAYLKAGIEQYLSKLQHYVAVECLETKPTRYTHGNQMLWRSKDTETIIKKIHPSETTIVLDEQGKQKSSLQLAQWFEKLKQTQHRQVNLVIGGAFGLDLSFFEKPALLSLSALTLPHQLVRLVLLEQVYRAFTIINGESYHHSFPMRQHL